MARVAALIPDLLFGSKIAEMLREAGHDVDLVSGGAGAWEATPGIDVLLVDLVSEGPQGVTALERLRAEGGMQGVGTLAVYSHVDVETRARAVDAGFDLVVPRSRMMREGGNLVEKLSGA